MAIESAKYYKDKSTNTNVAIIFVDSGVTKSVGVNSTDNTMIDERQRLRRNTNFEIPLFINMCKLRILSPFLSKYLA